MQAFAAGACVCGAKAAEHNVPGMPCVFCHRPTENPDGGLSVSNGHGNAFSQNTPGQGFGGRAGAYGFSASNSDDPFGAFSSVMGSGAFSQSESSSFNFNHNDNGGSTSSQALDNSGNDGGGGAGNVGGAGGGGSGSGGPRRSRLSAFQFDSDSSFAEDESAARVRAMPISAVPVHAMPDKTQEVLQIWGSRLATILRGHHSMSGVELQAEIARVWGQRLSLAHLGFRSLAHLCDHLPEVVERVDVDESVGSSVIYPVMSLRSMGPLPSSDLTPMSRPQPDDANWFALKVQVQAVLRSAAEAMVTMSPTEFAQKFFQEHAEAMSPRNFGFTTLEEVLVNMPDVVTVAKDPAGAVSIIPVGAKGIQLPVAAPGLETLKEQIATLVESADYILGTQFPAEFKRAFGYKLVPADWGFSSLKQLLLALPDVVVVSLDGQGAMVIHSKLSEGGRRPSGESSGRRSSSDSFGRRISGESSGGRRTSGDAHAPPYSTSAATIAGRGLTIDTFGTTKAWLEEEAPGRAVPQTLRMQLTAAVEAKGGSIFGSDIPAALAEMNSGGMIDPVVLGFKSMRHVMRGMADGMEIQDLLNHDGQPCDFIASMIRHDARTAIGSATARAAAAAADADHILEHADAHEQTQFLKDRVARAFAGQAYILGTQFPGEFKRAHGYKLCPSDWGFASLKQLLQSMSDVVTVMIDGAGSMTIFPAYNNGDDDARYQASPESDFNRTALQGPNGTAPQPGGGPPSVPGSQGPHGNGPQVPPSLRTRTAMVLSACGVVSDGDLPEKYLAMHRQPLDYQSHGFTSLRALLAAMPDVASTQQVPTGGLNVWLAGPGGARGAAAAAAGLDSGGIHAGQRDPNGQSLPDLTFLKSQVSAVVKGRSFVLGTQFPGEFKRAHGYKLRPADWGFASLKQLLQALPDVVTVAIDAQGAMTIYPVYTGPAGGMTTAFAAALAKQQPNTGMMQQAPEELLQGPFSVEAQEFVPAGVVVANVPAQVMQGSGGGTLAGALPVPSQRLRIQVAQVMHDRQRITGVDFPAEFRRIHGEPLRPQDHGFASLKLLLKAMPDMLTVQLEPNSVMSITPTFTAPIYQEPEVALPTRWTNKADRNGASGANGALSATGAPSTATAAVNGGVAAPAPVASAGGGGGGGGNGGGSVGASVPILENLKAQVRTVLSFTGKVGINDFKRAYGRALRPNDFGFSSLRQLFRAMPDCVMVSSDGHGGLVIEPAPEHGTPGAASLGDLSLDDSDPRLDVDSLTDSFEGGNGGGVAANGANGAEGPPMDAQGAHARLVHDVALVLQATGGTTGSDTQGAHEYEVGAFTSEWRRVHGRPLNPSDYGLASLRAVLRSVPEICFVRRNPGGNMVIVRSKPGITPASQPQGVVGSPNGAAGVTSPTNSNVNGGGAAGHSNPQQSHGGGGGGGGGRGRRHNRMGGDRQSGAGRGHTQHFHSHGNIGGGQNAHHFQAAQAAGRS